MSILPAKPTPPNQVHDFSMQHRTSARSLDAAAGSTRIPPTSGRRLDKGSNSFESLMASHVKKQGAIATRNAETKELESKDSKPLEQSKEASREAIPKSADSQAATTDSSQIGLPPITEMKSPLPQVPVGELDIAKRGGPSQTSAIDVAIDANASTRHGTGDGAITTDYAANSASRTMKRDLGGQAPIGHSTLVISGNTDEAPESPESHKEHSSLLQTSDLSPQALANKSSDLSGPKADNTLPPAINPLAQTALVSEGSRMMIEPRSSTEAHLFVREPFGEAAFTQAFASQVSILTIEGVSRAELSLNPPNMGPVQIEIRHYENGVEVDFKAAHPLTREAIQSSIDQLRERLHEQGMVLQDSFVQSLDTPEARELGDSDHTAQDRGSQQYFNPSSGQQHPKHSGSQAYPRNTYLGEDMTLTATAPSKTQKQGENLAHGTALRGVSVFA